MKQLKKVEYGIVVTLLVLNVLFSIVPVVNVHADINPADINYGWELDTFSAQIGKVWNNDNFLMNETGTYNEVFNHSRGYAISDTEWMEEESVFTYNVNYSYFSNLTLFGDYALNVNLDVYKVDISYGTAVSFIWVGFKNGTFRAEYNIYDVTHDFKHENSFYKKAETTYKKFNSTTMELLDAWNETIEDNGSWLSEDIPESEYTIHQTIDMEFSMPLILTFQIYETQNGEKVAWADMISDFYIFEDIDKNGVYSVGETSVEQNMFRMTTSDELRGLFMPWAFNYTLHTDYWSPEYSSNDTNNYKFPEDKEVNYFGDSIQFTPPQLVDNEIEWDILYPDFPIFGFVQTEEAWFTSGPNYNDSSPGNFSFGYNYEITNETADLDLTARLPRLSDVDFFNIVDNLSLAFPHYTFFLSSADIEESGNSVVTIPSDVFQFDIGGALVAEINMKEDKKYYSLMDYPDLGNNRTFEAIGSTVSKLVANELENNPTTPRNWFVDTIFTLGDLNLVKLDPQLSSAISLYNVEIQNYPTWSGYELIHDPTLTIYHNGTSSPQQEIPNDPDLPDVPGAISEYNLYIFAGIIGVITTIIAKRKKFKKSKFQL